MSINRFTEDGEFIRISPSQRMALVNEWMDHLRKGVKTKSTPSFQEWLEAMVVDLRVDKDHKCP